MWVGRGEAGWWGTREGRLRQGVRPPRLRLHLGHGGHDDHADGTTAMGRAVGRVVARVVGRVVGRAVGRTAGKAVGTVAGTVAGRAVERAVGKAVGSVARRALERAAVVRTVAVRAVERVVGKAVVGVMGTAIETAVRTVPRLRCTARQSGTSWPSRHQLPTRGAKLRWR